MQPATLLHTVMSSAGRDDQSNLDEQVNSLIRINENYIFTQVWLNVHPTQAYYVCYSLLTLVKEASNFQSCPPQQKVRSLFFHLKILKTFCVFCCATIHLSCLIFLFQEELLCLCSELETHVKCHIRENEKCLYRTRVSHDRDRNLFCAVLLLNLFCFTLKKKIKPCCATHMYTNKMVVCLGW